MLKMIDSDMKKLKNAMMGNRWKGEISRTILNIFRSYNGIDVLKLPFLDELYEKTFVVPYVFQLERPSHRDLTINTASSL